MVEDDQPYREFEDGRLRVFGYSYDVQAVQQIATVSGHGWVRGAALMADNHLGYSMPIGGVAAYREMTSPSGVGYDIGCGVMAVRTDVAFADVANDLGRLADEIAGRISFGIGRKNPTPVDHALFDSPVWREVPELTQEVRAKRGRGRCARAPSSSSAPSARATTTSTCWSSRPPASCGRRATSAAAGSDTASPPGSST